MIFSFFAYSIWIILAAFVFRAVRLSRETARETSPCARLGAYAVFLMALHAFFFLPPGSLPPFYNTPWGGIACVGLLLASQALSRREKAVFPCLVFAAVYAVFCWYAYYRGMPGSFANFGTLSAMPVWIIASPLEITGFALLVPVSLIALHRFRPTPESNCGLPEYLTFLAAAAVFVTLFLPWSFAPYVRWPAMPAAGADFLLFWLKIALCCGIVLRIPPLSCIMTGISTASGALGAALILL